MYNGISFSLSAFFLVDSVGNIRRYDNRKRFEVRPCVKYACLEC